MIYREWILLAFLIWVASFSSYEAIKCKKYVSLKEDENECTKKEAYSVDISNCFIRRNKGGKRNISYINITAEYLIKSGSDLNII